MKFLAITLLWCWNGAALGGGGGMSSMQGFNWPRPGDCQKEESLFGEHCGNPGYERRHFFNRTTKKCVKFIPEKCGPFDVGNNFKTRKDCMMNCMSKSPCLRPRWGKENGTVKGYTYFPDGDRCYSTKYGKKVQFMPERNKFKTEEECINGCAPVLLPKSWRVN
uniref:Putative kunitz-type serine protease inhibitor n=1 Tax=Amblyomma parvum TaxID=251391 RepID=A0A023FYP6_AMBPA